MDSGWFGSLLDAFFESFASTPLSIWRVFKGQPGVSREPLSLEGAWEATWELVKALRAEDPSAIYSVRHSIHYGRN